MISNSQRNHGEISLASTETRWKRLIVQWTGRRGLAAIIVFFIISLIIEILLVYSFQMFGLVDRNTFAATLTIPSTNWSFTVSVSPLFELLPLSVVVVLLSSWAYLTRYTASIPQRGETAKRVPPTTQRTQEGRRFKSARRIWKRLTRRLQRVSRAVKSGVQHIRGVSYISERLAFAGAAVRSAVTVLALYIIIVIMLFIIEYPDLIRQWTIGLYMAQPSFRNFVVGTIQGAQGVDLALPPLGSLASAINNALIGAGPGFRHSLESAGTSVTGGVTTLNVMDKYVLTQNLAAWSSALIALVYGAYASSRPQRRPRSR